MEQGSKATKTVQESRLQSILSRARALRGSKDEIAEEELSLSVELGRELLREARRRESSQETQARLTLARLLLSKENQLFSTALTDRIHRTSSPARAVEVLTDLAERTGTGRDLPTLDRMQLRAARMFGSVVPKLTVNAVLHRLRDEAMPYLWDAEPEALKGQLLARHKSGFSINLNYLGEEVLGEEEAAARLSAYASFVARPDIEAVSVKLSGIDPHLELLALEETASRLTERLQTLLRAGRQRPSGPPLLYFDMEAYRDLPVTEAVLLRLLETSPKEARFGLAVQAYLPESLGLVERLAEASASRVATGGAPLRIRLVKGANLQTERVEASRSRLEVPIFGSKREVDAHFKRVLRVASDRVAQGQIVLGVGSHNLFDIAYALVIRERLDLGTGLCIEMLEGMAGRLGEVVAQLSGALLLYAPAVLEGNFASAVSYLVRRLDENTAKDNFLRAAPHMMPDDDAFLQQAEGFMASARGSFSSAPSTRRRQNRTAPEKRSSSDLLKALDTPFENAADTDFTRPMNRAWIRRELDAMKKGDQVRVVPILASPTADAPPKTESGFDPSRPDYRYPIELCSFQDIEGAILAAEAGISSWRATPVRERGRILLRIADLLEEQRGQLISAMVLDGGKRVQEADVEVSEAVDFARYYAREGLTLEPELAPRGVVVVTPPWNFPLAIPLGGVFGALMAGNTVILKPAPETPWVAFLGASLCRQAGVPGSALQFLPCRDEDAGPLLTDPRVNAVVLTGATETAKFFLKTRPDLCLMAETGGKNGAYVGPVSDREQAISDIVRSAFFHAGQKCSALSVLVLHREVFENENFKRQLVDAAKSLPVGSAWDPRSIVTPLIHPPSGHLRTLLKNGHEYGEWLLEPAQDEDNPRILSPGILWGVAPGSFPHLTEFFGPVLSVLCADDFDEAMDLLNTPAYGLTAGLFSLDDKEHELFAERVHAGNLYINRGTTGAVVGRQPFGGHKESCFGPGAKAGGPDYVRQMTLSLPSGKSEHELLAFREETYDLAFETHFGRVHRGTEVVGEENYFRYLPGKTAVVLGEGAQAIDIRFSVKARALCRAHFPIFILSGSQANRTGQLLGQQRVDSETLDGEALVARAKELGLERLRVVGLASPELLRAAAQAKLSVIGGPVSDFGRQELAFYLRSQSISFASHRHGNTSLAALSRLESSLDIWFE